MLGCNVDARRSREVDVRRVAGIENKDGDEVVVGRLLREDKRRSMRGVCEPNVTKAVPLVQLAQFHKPRFINHRQSRSCAYYVL